jgi:hypothetical protein
MIPTLASAPQDFQALKLHIVDSTGLAKDALHVYAGLAIFIGVRLIWRWRGGWVVAWLAALALALGVEYMDILGEGQRGTLQPDPAHWHDVWNTMVWPTILLLVGRWLQPRPKPKLDPSSDLADEALKEPPTI